MLCQNCQAELVDAARFCSECGLATVGIILPEADYSYETSEKLFPWRVVVQILLAVWLPFTGIGVLVALTEGFWFVPLIMSSVVLLAIFIIAWLYKGRKQKWGVNRTLWVLTPEGLEVGYPPDVAKRLAVAGAASATVTAGRQNWRVTALGLEMAKNLSVVHGLPILPWTDFTAAEYRPDKYQIALYRLIGGVSLVQTNPDNYTYTEQLLRFYLSSQQSKPL